ncbi:MAG: glycosyltransferase family 2 protein, partial [Cyanobacteria bacterium P01_H01_bin.15]
MEETLDAILAQTFADFELIIADNVSTDRTEEICRVYAAKDARIRYVRNEENLGPAWNHNRVFELSTGEYFKWAAHDDLMAPDLIEKCVEALDQDFSIVLSHGMANVISDTECPARGKYDIELNTDSGKPHQRLFGLMFGDKKFGDHRCYQVYGLIRSAALKKTDVMGFYAHADGVLLVHIAFLGPFHKIPEYLFFP